MCSVFSENQYRVKIKKDQTFKIYFGCIEQLEKKSQEVRSMKFEKENYKIEELTLENETIRFRSFRNLTYVEHPVNKDYQQMNIFAPEAYYEGKKINGYTLETAPVFMPNTVGGYMPGDLDEPGYHKFEKGKINSIFRALQHGYVVAAPAIRGRVQKDEEGKYNGKAPACIVDYKAAVRYLHYFSEELPGDENKIITNGTSAGGALSSLMGATGNHPDYEPYLKELGAADASDTVFAASCYCPITNLDHADMAYEWEFQGANDYHRMHMQMAEGGRPSFTPVDGVMSAEQIKVSEEEGKIFPEYVNSLNLKDENGTELTLDADGNGSFKDYVKKIVMASAQNSIDHPVPAKMGPGPAPEPAQAKEWLTIENGKVTGMDFDAYVRDITRMKTAPAFDDLGLHSPENDLFGNAEENCRHFTEYSTKNSTCDGDKAEELVIKMMNPMYYIEDEKADTAKHFRIRHGECDRDTSLAISAMLTLKLREAGCEVDYHSPWNVPHAGDYDLEELFAWIDEICK